MDLAAYNNASVPEDGTVSSNRDFIQPGDVDFEELTLISSLGTAVSLLDYYVEFNLYEYIFNNTLSGDIVISDSRNLIKLMPILGEEILVVKYRTPESNFYIQKCFKIYAVENRRIVRDQNTQIYTLKFCSFESILDSVSTIYSSFQGKISEVISQIYNDYLSVPRTYVRDGGSYVESDSGSSVYFINDTSNNVKFVSPGWTPLQCINWLASKSKPEQGSACNFLFWESNKNFYYGNIEGLFTGHLNRNRQEIPYRLAAATVKGVGGNGTDDLNEKMYLIEDLQIVKTGDYLEKVYSGYFASKNISIDFINKNYTTINYDHLSKFKDYTHSSGRGGVGIFNNSLRNSHSHISFHSKSPELFTNFKNNVNEFSAEIYGNRLSHLHELNLLKMHIVIPGRTDLEAGSLIDIDLPDLGPVDETDETKGYRDPFYSGSYLVSAIRHKITGGIHRYSMVAEVVKDTLGSARDNETATLSTIFSDVI